MNKNDLEMILQEGEGYKTEFKEHVTGLDREIVAFANSSGGRIFIGVTDSGQPQGIHINNRLKSQVQDIANNCRPKPFILLEERGKVLVVNVREGTDKPYECSSGFFKKMGPNSQKMTRNEIIEMFKSEGKIRFDELIEPNFDFKEDFDTNKFNRFLSLAGISKIGNTEKLLTSLGVAEKQEGKIYFNNAGVLFFAKEPQRFVPWSVFTVALFKDEAGVDIIDRKEIGGSLFEIVEEVMKFVTLYSKVAYRFTGKPQRENVYEYSFKAIREAVINSVMHKYYLEHGHNNILRFLPSRIRIENYWLKPGTFILGKTVFRRNHIIADLFSKIHFGEKMGTGFERIREMCKKDNAPFPEVTFNENYFYTLFKPSFEYLQIASTAENVSKNTDENALPYFGINFGINFGIKGERLKRIVKILEIYSKEQTITAKQLASHLNTTSRTIENDIDFLKGNEFICFCGARKTGKYVLTEKGIGLFATGK